MPGGRREGTAVGAGPQKLAGRRLLSMRRIRDRAEQLPAAKVCRRPAYPKPRTGSNNATPTSAGSNEVLSKCPWVRIMGHETTSVCSHPDCRGAAAVAVWLALRRRFYRPTQPDSARLRQRPAV